jgi:hypothetical protein
MRAETLTLVLHGLGLENARIESSQIETLMQRLGEAYKQIESNQKREKSIHTVRRKKNKGATTGHSTAARSPKGWTRALARSRRRRH